MSPPINSPTDVLLAVTEIISRIGKIENLSPDQDFYAAGVTSMMSLPILLEMEDHFQVSLPDDRFIGSRTARALEHLISELRGK